MGLIKLNTRKMMLSNGRHLCLVVLLFSVDVSLSNAIEHRYSTNGHHSNDYINRPNSIPLSTKYNKEIGVRRPQTAHHHIRHENHHRSRSSENHHKQKHNHQSHDTAVSPLPGYQPHSSEKHSHYDDNASAIGVGGLHKTIYMQQEQPSTTLGRFKNRRNYLPWMVETAHNRNHLDNLTRDQLESRSSMNRYTHNPYSYHNNHVHRTTTTTSTTTTMAPDDQDGLNNVDSDEDDYDEDFGEDYARYGGYGDDNDSKKRSPPTFDHFNNEANNDYQQDEPGSINEEKWITLGNQAAVENTFRMTMPVQIGYKANTNLYHQYSTCKEPKLMMVHLEHNSSYTFYPHCAVLGRCSDQTGCCGDDLQYCTADNVVNVKIMFKVIDPQKRYIFEYKNFENHTSCRCARRNETNANTRPTRDTTDVTTKSVTARVSKSDNKSVGQYVHLVANSSKCRCPGIFVKKHQNKCKCYWPTKSDYTLNRLATGIEGFSIRERRCIANNLCEKPNCLTGEYSIEEGRCIAM